MSADDRSPIEPSDHSPETEPLDDGTALADHPLTAVRLAKLEALRDRGIEPFPPGFDRTHMAASLHEQHRDLEAGAESGAIVTVAGRMMNVRSFGKLRFAVLRDSSDTIQLFVSKAALGDEQFEVFELLDAGDWVGASGEVIKTKKGELSVKVTEIHLLAKALRPLPDKWHGLQDVEGRFRQRYLDLAVNEEARSTATARATIVRSMRTTFETHGFLEVETPMLQVKPGGALAKPFVTHHNALGLDMYLRIAPELYLKRLVVGGMERVFEINRNFRNEGIDSTHNPEFTMLEAYQAYADYEDMIALVQQTVIDAAAAVGVAELTYQGRSVDLGAPFDRVTMLDAVNGHLDLDIDYEMDIEALRSVAASHGVDADAAWGTGRIVAELFEEHVEGTLWNPTFVLEYPIETSPLARNHRSLPYVTERFELIATGREMANAFTELNDPAEQRRRFESQAAARAAGDEEAHLIDEDYLKALEYGLPPTGGLGIGVDRIVMLLTDQASIREVVLFPHLRPEA